MINKIVLDFALLFAAIIALICAVYVALIFRAKKKRQIIKEELNEEESYI